MKLAEKFAGRVINIRALPFTEDRSILFDDIRSSTICIMPSWHEGFGLVAWEAIAAGIPLIVSRKSGVHQLLGSHKNGALLGWYESVDIRGSAEDPFFHDVDKKLVSDKIISIVKDISVWKDRARSLRETLLAEYSWEECGASLIRAAGWEVGPVSVHNVSSISSPQVAHLGAGGGAKNISSWLRWLEIPAPVSAAGGAPSQLLKAEEAAMPFDPVAMPFLDDLKSWVRGPCSPEVKLLTGRGGAGKTRTAIELCQHLRDEGYIAGFLSNLLSSKDIDDFMDLALQDADSKYVLVIDYAETRTNEFIKILSRSLAGPGCVKIKILLLARSGGDWWDQLPSRNSKCEEFLSGEGCTGPFPVPALYAKDGHRAVACRAATMLFAGRLGLPCPASDPDVSEDHFANPLFLQMAALMNVLGERARSEEGLPRSLINHERRYWRAMNGQGGASEEDCLRIMALASLCDGISSSESIRREWIRSGGEKASLKSAFFSLLPLYPGRKGLSALKPDLIGEALVAQRILGIDGDGLVDAALGSSQSAIRYSGLTCLARALKHRPDIISAVCAGLVRNYHLCGKELIRVCVENEGGISLAAAQAFDALPFSARSQVAEMLTADFKQEIIPLAALDVAIEKTNCDVARRKAEKSSGDKASVYYATCLLNLAAAHGRNGSLASSLECSMSAESILAKVARRDFSLAGHALARALAVLGSNICESGDAARALSYNERSEEIFRDILNADRDSGAMRELADLLSDKAVVYLGLGDGLRALSAASDSVEVYSDLASKGFEDAESGLASGLNNYANRLSDVGRMDDAMSASMQSLLIYRRLDSERPERHRMNLAISLMNHATLLASAGDSAGALAASSESVEIISVLSRIRPTRFEDLYARALSNSAVYFFEASRYSEAMECSAHAALIAERLHAGDAERYLSLFAEVLKVHADVLCSCGRLVDALEKYEIAWNLGLSLVARSHEKFSPYQVGVLYSKSLALFDLGDPGAARDCLREGLDFRLSSSQLRLTTVSRMNCNARLWGRIMDLIHDMDQFDGEIEFDTDVLGRSIGPVLCGAALIDAVAAESSVELERAISSADSAWESMDEAQRVHLLAHYYVVLLIAESRIDGAERKLDLDDLYSKIIDQRGGLPVWVSLLATKLGLDFLVPKDRGAHATAALSYG